MSGILARYAHFSFPPEYRAANFVAGEPRLTWTSLFLEDFPNADIYLVGGTLRDSILGVLPSDVDIVIRNVTVKQLRAWLQVHGAYDFVGKTFGTFKFVPHGCQSMSSIDIALPRTESIGQSHQSGRSDLDVKFDPRLTIKEDLSRRDFTINAMAFDLKRGALIDPHNGLRDLHDQIIRAVGDANERFFEDATRMLRGMRFACQLGFGIEQHTWEAIQKFKKLLNNTTLAEDGTHSYVVPRELIGREFLLAFSRHPSHAVRLWQESGALIQFLPNIANLQDIVEEDQQNAFEKMLNILHVMQKPSLLAAHRLQKPSTTALVAALFTRVDIDAQQNAFKTCKDLYFHQFPNTQYAYVNCRDVMFMLEHLHHFEEIDPASMRPSEFERVFCTKRGQQLLLLMHAVHITSGVHSVARERLHNATRIALKLTRDLCPNGEALKHLVSGSDIGTLGVEPGPIYRELIDHARDAQLSGKIKTKDQALDLLREHVRNI
jgi:tRNA nucleotidyltransferase/poly(A) polymerase